MSVLLARDRQVVLVVHTEYCFDEIGLRAFPWVVDIWNHCIE